MQQRIFGFDIGTTSIGFSVIDLDEGSDKGKIVWLGSRIFPEGVTEKEREPRNKKRRDARMMRRQMRRKKLRRRLVEQVLQDHGMLPEFDSQEWHALVALDPWALRIKALEDKLTLQEIGRIIYHLLKRRGFKSSRMEEDGKKDDSGVIKKGIAELQEKMGDKTLSQTLVNEGRKRNRHVGRDMVLREFDRVWDAQKKHYPAILTVDLRKTLYTIGSTQRPVFWRTATLGTCWLEPESPLCLKASWRGQQFVMLQKLNSLRITTDHGRPLTTEERAVVYDLLMSQQSATFGGIRKALKKTWEEKDGFLKHQFNYEIGDNKPLPGNIVEAKLKAIFGAEWVDFPAKDTIRAELADWLYTIWYGKIGGKKIVIRNDETDIEKAKQAFIEHACVKWRVSEEQAEKLAEIDLPPGWLRHSVRAINNMLPYLEEGRLYSSKEENNLGAMQMAYPQAGDVEEEACEKLSSHPKTMPDLRNPTVNRALNELRKVANNLIAAYGKPDLIRLELARDLKLSGKRLDEANKRTREREKERQKAAQALSEKGISNPNRDDIEKWLLWQECSETCPYTGKKIGFDELFGSNVLYQIEHIFPRSRSLDNGYANKTLCHVDVNRAKGNKTPYEYFGPEKLEEIKVRLDQIGMPENKKRRFLSAEFDELGDADFDERQLRDTAYIAVEARKFLQRLFGKKPEDLAKVETCNGRITARLRRYWGLNTILGETGEKNREDHRHHAVDAITIAMASRKHIKRLADSYARDYTARAEQFPPPWPNFRTDACAAIENIVVSHKVQKKVSGPLHAETALGDTGLSDPENKKLRLFVKRKPVAILSPADIKDGIRDEGVRRLIVQHIEKQGLDPTKGSDVKKALSRPVHMISKDGRVVPVNKVRILIKQQPNLMVLRNAKCRAYADLGQNHHMAIYRAPSGKAVFEVVSLFEAASRLSRKEPVVRKQHSSGAPLVMSLCSGDMLCFEENGKSVYRYVSSVWAAGPVVVHDHRLSRQKAWGWPRPSALISDKVKKVSVDPIGRVRDAND